jgi:hypothetical protein
MTMTMTRMRAVLSGRPGYLSARQSVSKLGGSTGCK